MNKRQKLVQQQFINNEEAVIKRLKETYGEALEGIEKSAKSLQDEINSLDALIDLTDDEAEKAVLESRKQSKVYQKQYQDAMKKQVSSILDNMQVEEFKTVDAYLKQCYEDGFIGTMYDLQGQGIPLCFPLDQEAMVRAVQTDSKISEGLYSRLGEDVSELKKKITSEISRGIATGKSFQQIAKQLSAQSNIGFNRAVRIARTEGHRIQVQGTMDACFKAKEKGADVVKQWDATLDAKTRDSHVMVDGEIRELDEKFSNGLMFAGDPSGGAAEVVNCRCALLQRARWALEGAFTKYDQFSGEIKQFESQEAYDAFKKDYFSKENRQYMKYVDEMKEKYGTKDFSKVMTKMTDSEYNHFVKLQKARPTFEGMYRGQNVVKVKGETFDEFKKEYKGLAAKISGKGVPEHEEPAFVQTIKAGDVKSVKKVLQNFEKSAIMSNVETACVITKDGHVYKCFGTEDRVFPDFDLKDKLKGATVTHNHTEGKTSYTFSQADLELFMDYDLEVLRGCDVKYTYEFSRNPEQSDEFPEEWMTFENFRHSEIVRMAKEYGIGYRRWLNE